MAALAPGRKSGDVETTKETCSLEKMQKGEDTPTKNKRRAFSRRVEIWKSGRCLLQLLQTSRRCFFFWCPGLMREKKDPLI
jgi:hypothetical protein